jgi:trehalose 6-phosphate synthase/phosphatase
MPCEKASLFDVVDDCREGPLTLLLDYDGTLVPIAARPELAAPDDDLLELLAALSTRPGTDLHIVSGRRREDIEVWFGALAASLWAEHGFWYRPRPPGLWQAAAPLPADALRIVRPFFERLTAATPGSFIEEKTAALAWHYRGAEPALTERDLRDTRRALDEVLVASPLELLAGKKVLEVRLRGISKALAAQRALEGHVHATKVLAIGDDETDEELFRALPESSVTIAVGLAESSAKFHLDNHDDARRVLRALIRGQVTKNE